MDKRLRASALPIVVACCLVAAPVSAGQTSQGRLRGAVTDSSGGVLPGVTVIATSADGRLLATTVSDSSGHYVFQGLPAGAVTLTFQLEGFAEAVVVLSVDPGTELRAVQRLELASLSETVVVHAPAVAARPRPRFDLPPPPPPLVARPLPEHDRGAVCGPTKPDPASESLGTIKGRRHETQGGLYLAGAELVVTGGQREGLLVGRNLVVRRRYHARGAANIDMLAEHSAGLVQIVAAGEHSSVAVVVYTCDEIRKGDFLASFKPEPVREPDSPGTPAFHDAARILFADEGQALGLPQRLMVIDRGSDKGAHIGQRYTLFRQPGGIRRTTGGEAVVVGVRPDSATIRVDQVTDAIAAGDWAAPQSATSAAREPQ